jgi:hypothetical protein
LPREAVGDAVRHIRKIFKEGAKEPSRAKLDGKTQTVVVAAVGVYEPSIAVIQVEVTGQLFWAQFSDKATVPIALLFSQETDGNGPPLHVWGRHSQNLQGDAARSRDLAAV